MLRWEEGHAKEAIEDCDQAVSLDPAPANYLARALIREGVGDVRGALEDYGQALDRAPPDWPLRTQAEAARDRLAGALPARP